jgi:hypothetical protein
MSLPLFGANNSNMAAPADPNSAGLFGMDKDTMGMIGMGLSGLLGGGGGALKSLMMLKMLDGDQGLNSGGANAMPLNNQTSMAPPVPGIPPLQSPYSMQGLNPKLQAAIPMIMSDMVARGWQPQISSGIRTPEEQAQKVAQGYSQTMNSKHLVGKAVDITDKRYGWDGPAADTNYQFWNDLGESAKRHGMQWGGDWKNFKDVAHIQTSLLNNRMRLQQLSPNASSIPNMLNRNSYNV